MVADDGRILHAYGLEAERTALEDGAVFCRAAGQYPADLVYYGPDRNNSSVWIFSAALCTQVGAEVGFFGLYRDYSRVVLLPDVLPGIHRELGTGGALY